MKAQHEAFAFAIARGKEPKAAYIEIYPKVQSDGAIRVALSRLLKREDIQTAIANKKNELVTKADELALQELKDEHKRHFLTLADKREVLYKIAMGEKTPHVEKDGVIIYRYPSDNDKIRAVELDAELTGEGWRPPEPENPGGPSITQNNTYIKRVTVFNTRTTTAKAQEVQQTTTE